MLAACLCLLDLSELIVLLLLNIINIPHFTYSSVTMVGHFRVSNPAATTTLLQLVIISCTGISFYDRTIANCVIKHETLHLFFTDLIFYLCFTPQRNDIVHAQIQTKPVSSGMKTWQGRCQLMSLFNVYHVVCCIVLYSMDINYGFWQHYREWTCIWIKLISRGSKHWNPTLICSSLFFNHTE